MTKKEREQQERASVQARAYQSLELLLPSGSGVGIKVFYHGREFHKLVSYFVVQDGKVRSLDTLVAAATNREVKCFADTGYGVPIHGGDGSELLATISLHLHGTPRAIGYYTL